MYIIAQAPSAAVVSSTAVGTVAFNVIAGEPGAGTQCNLNAPGSNKLNGQPFVVRAAGFTTYAAGTYTASTVQIALNASNTASFAAAAGNQIASLTAFVAITYASASATAVPWEIEVEMSGDGTSKILMGEQAGYQGTSANAASTIVSTARVAAANPLTTFNPATEPPVQFAVSVISGGAQPTVPVSTLTQLVLEA